VSTSQPSHIEDAVASLDIELTADETAAQEAPYTPVVRDFPRERDRARGLERSCQPSSRTDRHHFRVDVR
jgi:hypothetical protein